MAYRDFRLETVETALGVVVREGDLFPSLVVSPVPGWLPEWIERGTQLAYLNEKSRGEFLVAPVLLALRELSGNQVAIFSGQRLDVDVDLGLIGKCDFILTIGPACPPLRAPLGVLLQAKRNDVEAGLGQCIAQMVAARAFNAQAGRGPAPVYGCVTTGETWQFLRLDESSVVMDVRRRYLVHVGEVLGVLRRITSEAGAA